MELVLVEGSLWCPRCRAKRVDVTNPNDAKDVLHNEFSCGSWWDRYSKPSWTRECYQAQGIDGLREYLSHAAYNFAAYEKTGKADNPFKQELLDAVELLFK